MRYLAALILSMILSIPVLSNREHSAVIKRAANNVHEIKLHTINDDSRCSATAIGPHALLTASHCELPTSRVVIDKNSTPIAILGIIRDEQDHTILLVDTTFKSYADMATSPLEMGDDVFIIGNPSDFRRLYRKGVVASIERNMSVRDFMWLAEEYSKGYIIYLDLNGYFGDSGAAIFNEQGEICGVVNEMATRSHEEDPSASIKIMKSYSLDFTQAEIDKAIAFVPVTSLPDAPEAKPSR